MAHPDVWLLIAGRDKHARKFEKLAQALGISSRVKFLGPVANVREVYGTADALILPTLYDPFPNVCVEALACGLPLLTSHGCGAAEWITEGQNGWVRDALDSEGYQQAISLWLKGREQGVDYSAAARATAEPFTPTEWRKSYRRFIVICCAERHRRRLSPSRPAYIRG